VRHQKFCRFVEMNPDKPLYGLIEGNYIFALGSSPFDGTQTDTSEINRINRIDIESVRLLAPATPTKIVCVGRNYKAHAEELGNKMPDEPLIFLKPASSVIATKEEIVIPPSSNQVEHEGEIGVVIGRKAARLDGKQNPLDYVFGYTCLNDVTARDLQRKDLQFTRGKSFDTFCPVGPFIATGLDPTDITLTTRVNGIVRQHGNSKDMAFPIAYLIQYISNIMTLLPGDIIATGTPAGVSKLDEGDIVDVEVDGIGVLSNPVKNLSA